jgi:hypothetical protein
MVYTLLKYYGGNCMVGALNLQRFLRAAIALLLIVSLVLTIGAGKADAAITGEVTYEGAVAQSYGCSEEPCGLNGDDDYSEAIPIGFDFDYYGTTFTDVYLNINGAMHFSCPTDEYSNEALPTEFDGDCDFEGDIGDTRPMAILAFWDDLITTPKDLYCDEDPIVDDCDSWNWDGNYPTILYKTVGTAGSRKFIAQWTNMHLYSNPNIPLGTFQIILYENNAETTGDPFQIQYRNLLGDPDRSSGSSTTVGTQNDDMNFTQYSYEASPPLEAETAIRFTHGEGYGYDDEAAYDAVYLGAPGSPSRPVLSTPANAATDVVLNPTFEWTESESADTYTLTLATDAGFSDVVTQLFDLESTEANLEDLLDPETTYYWIVRAVNEVGDIYSDAGTFTTGSDIEPPSDDDGITTPIEDGAPNSGDANNDGTPDSQQPKVTSLISPVSTKYVVLESTSCGGNSNVGVAQEKVEADKKDGSYDYPFGLLDFTLTGCSVGVTETITQYYYGDYAPFQVTLRKYNETTHAYTTITDAVITQVTIGGQAALKVVYQVTDGGALDADGTANGTIVDPAGLAVLGASTPAAPDTGLLAKSALNSTLFVAMGIAFGYAGLRHSKNFRIRK